jgi:hypothetical protein
MTTITKLKAVYERLQESFTMQNKLEFDQVVWATLPELWNSEVSVTRPKVASKQQIGKRSMVRNYVNSVTVPASTNDILRHFESVGVSVSRDTVTNVLASDPRAKKLSASDSSSAKYLDPSCKVEMWVVFPNGCDIDVPVFVTEPKQKPKKYATTINRKTPPKSIKPTVTTPFLEWFEANYELADGFTPILEIIQKCDHIISEDRAKDQLKSKGYLVYNRPAGGCVQARPIKKQKSEFVNLTEVLKEMK